MLGLPPAFVLSQNQTLKLKWCYHHILNVRTSAHLNWPHIREVTSHHTPYCRTHGGHLIFAVSRFTKVNKKPHQTWSWHSIIGIKPKSLIWRSPSVETKPNRPHISSDTINFKEPETKINRSACGFPLARPPLSVSIYQHLRVSLTASLLIKGVLVLVSPTRNPFFQ